MLKTSETQCAQQFREYMLKHRSAVQHLQAIESDLDGVKQARDKAEHAAAHDAGEIARDIGYQCKRFPDQGVRKSIAASLWRGIRDVPAGQQSLNQRDWVSQLEKHQAALEAREAALTYDTERLAVLEKAREESVVRLAEVEAQQPKASAAAVEAVTEDMNRAQDELILIEEKLEMARTDLEALLADDSGVSHLDELEARAALDSEQGVSGTELTKARKVLEKAQNEKVRLDARIRGLEGLRAKEVARLTELKGLRKHVGLIVSSAEQVKREQQLQHFIAEVKKAEQSVNEGRREINVLLPDGQEWGLMDLQIKGLRLYAVQEQGEPAA